MTPDRLGTEAAGFFVTMHQLHFEFIRRNQSQWKNP